MSQDDDGFARRTLSDASPVDFEDEATRRAWCAEFGATETQLRAAAAAVGLMPIALRFYLRASCAQTKRAEEKKAALDRQDAPGTRPPRDRSR